MARLAILTLFMGQTRNRFLQYQQPRTILEILDMAGRTEGCEGVELRYPGDLADPQAVKAALLRNNLGIAAINFASVRPAIARISAMPREAWYCRKRLRVWPMNSVRMASRATAVSWKVIVIRTTPARHCWALRVRSSRCWR